MPKFNIKYKNYGGAEESKSGDKDEELNETDIKPIQNTINNEPNYSKLLNIINDKIK